MTHNILVIDGHKAVVAYDPDINLLRGEFIGLNGGADFYASDIAGLVAEGAASLREFLAVCREQGLEPYRSFSGRLNLRLDDLHEAVAVAAAAVGVSINQYIVDALRERVAVGEPADASGYKVTPEPRKTPKAKKTLVAAKKPARGKKGESRLR